MPSPMLPDGQAPAGRDDFPPSPRRPSPGPRSERDSAEVALHLPAWDLVPPTEFLDRHRR